MRLSIDGKEIVASVGESLLDLVRKLGMDTRQLSQRPLAAKIAGEIFTLNYIPVRQVESNADRPSIRRAMAASNGEIHLLRYQDTAGKEAYSRTAQFVIFLAMRQLWPQATVKMNCTVGNSVFIEVTGDEDFDTDCLKQRMEQIVEQDIPLLRRRIPLSQAIENFRKDGQTDKARLLSWRSADYFDEYAYGDFADYFYGEMMPSTGYLSVWDIRPAENGFLFVYPDNFDPDHVARYLESPNFFQVFSEGEKWCSLMECETVAD